MTIEARLSGNGRWSPWRIAGWTLAALLLALPAVAMRFTAEVVWTASDFVVMGVLLGAVGLGIEYLVRRSTSVAYRLGAVAAAGTAFLTLWVNLAVGMIGEPDNAYNLLFGVVLLIAGAGAGLARFRPGGMAYAMLAAAAAQAVLGAIGSAADPRGGLFSAGFGLLWLVAAALFSAARNRT